MTVVWSRRAAELAVDWRRRACAVLAAAEQDRARPCGLAMRMRAGRPPSSLITSPPNIGRPAPACLR